MRLSDRDRKCDLGSPVREICTPGSERGDGYKAPCRLGEATASKGAALARLRKGYRAEACPYQPCHRPWMVGPLYQAPRGRFAGSAAHPEMAGRQRDGERGVDE